VPAPPKKSAGAANKSEHQKGNEKEVPLDTKRGTFTDTNVNHFTFKIFKTRHCGIAVADI